ncbi:MAG: hypothetical protein HY686_02400 [Chloroflexi bacterium]|nr:hypothetical protein [Chloroflexota bacterium]
MDRQDRDVSSGTLTPVSRKWNVFLIECPWVPGDELKQKRSLMPVLELVKSAVEIEYIYHTCLTKEEFFECLRQWTETKYDVYNFLYLGFHGAPGIISLPREEISIDEIANCLREAGGAKNRVIYFGSCGTLHTDRRNLTRFLRVSNALAICGFVNEVDWLRAAVFEALLISQCQNRAKDGRGVRGLEKEVKEKTAGLWKALGFRFEYLPY